MPSTRLVQNRSFTLFILFVLFANSFSVLHVGATSACDDRTSDPNTLLRIFNTDGDFIVDYKFEYTSHWCVADNVLLRYSDSEVLIQTKEDTFSVFDVDSLNQSKEIQLVRSYNTSYSGTEEIALVNNSLLYWRNGLAPNYVLHDLQSGQVTPIPLNIHAIEVNNLTNEFDMLKFDSTWKKPKLIVTTNYNNWVAYGYHDSQDYYRDDIDRNYIIHTGNQFNSSTIFVERLTNFMPSIYALSPNGETLVLANENNYQGFVSYSLFSNQKFTYQPIDSNSFSTHLTGISVSDDKIWFMEYNSNTLFRTLKYMNLSNGTVVNVGRLNSPDAISGFVVVGNYVFFITNAKDDNLTGLIIVFGIVIILVIVLLAIRRK